MTKDEIERFYLTNHDFNIIVNKGSMTYGKTKDEMLANAIVQEICKEMQKGGCNEERDYGSEDSGCASATGTASTCQA